MISEARHPEVYGFKVKIDEVLMKGDINDAEIELLKQLSRRTHLVEVPTEVTFKLTSNSGKSIYMSDLIKIITYSKLDSLSERRSKNV